MEIAKATALRMYDTARRATGGGASAAGRESTAATALERAGRSFVETLQKGEDTAKQAMTGQADLPSLVAAMAQTELAVQTAVTVRDKVVEAYQEILRMPV